MDTNKGLILNIQRMSTEDGPGLRTTVFFKGCPLKCEWCHNPESISFKKELEWFCDRCIHCGTCIETCTENALAFMDGQLTIDYTKCSLCMDCSVKCPANALEAKGVNWTAADLANELEKDKAYFKNGGGVTLSGGEAMVQGDFLFSLVKELNGKKIPVAIDTCGVFPFITVEKIFPFVDIFLYDIKLMNSENHKFYTGAGNETIIDNLLLLAEKIRRSGDKRLWIRTPLIPGASDSIENITAIGAFISENISDVVERWELCAFNNLCGAKYKRMGYDWNYEGIDKLTISHMNSLHEAIGDQTLKDKTFVTGSARLEAQSRR